jgi:hypothetical protein
MYIYCFLISKLLPHVNLIIIIQMIHSAFLFCLRVFCFFLFSRAHFVIGLWAVKFALK